MRPGLRLRGPLFSSGLLCGPCTPGRRPRQARWPQPPRSVLSWGARALAETADGRPSVLQRVPRDGGWRVPHPPCLRWVARPLRAASEAWAALLSSMPLIGAFSACRSDLESRVSLPCAPLLGGRDGGLTCQCRVSSPAQVPAWRHSVAWVGVVPWLRYTPRPGRTGQAPHCGGLVRGLHAYT